MPRYECRVGRIEADITTFRMLARMSWVATKLYNTAVWSARETWTFTGKIPTGFDLQTVVLASPYHVLLPAHTYQHPAHQVGMAFKSWYALRKRDRTAHPPGFRRKEALSFTKFTKDEFRLVDGRIMLTVSQGLKDELCYTRKFLPLGNIIWNTKLPEDGQINRLEIVPENGYFNVHAKILLPEPLWRSEGQVVAVDLGMRNPMVTIDTRLATSTSSKEVRSSATCTTGTRKRVEYVVEDHEPVEWSQEELKSVRTHGEARLGPGQTGCPRYDLHICEDLRPETDQRGGGRGLRRCQEEQGRYRQGLER